MSERKDKELVRAYGRRPFRRKRRVDARETARIRERLRAVQWELEQLFDVIRSFQADE